MKIGHFKKQIIIVGILLAGFSFGFGVRSLFTEKFAIVDLQKIITNSEDVQNLRTKNDKNVKELSAWLDKAKAEIDAENKKAKKEELIREYKEIAKNREEKIKKAYQEKLLKIEDNINALIKKSAQKKGCKLILTKKSIVQGGVDITQEIIKEIKLKKQ